MLPLSLELFVIYFKVNLNLIQRSLPVIKSQYSILMDKSICYCLDPLDFPMLLKLNKYALLRSHNLAASKPISLSTLIITFLISLN